MDFTTDQILTIEPCGVHDVFDLQVERTENFIANGLVSHNTRWHIDDLAGRLLLEEEAGGEFADEWDVVSLPAIATEEEWLVPTGTFLSPTPKEGHELVRRAGDALHPERYPLKALQKIQATIQPRHWEALYQQDPQPESGAFFNPTEIRYGVPPLLAGCKILIAADTASSTADSADDSCIVAGAIDGGGNIWILDMFVGRISVLMFVEVLLDMFQKYPNTVSVGIESGPIGEAILPILKVRMGERRVFPPLADKAFMRPTASKEIRARPLQGMIQHGKVWFPDPKHASWVPKALAQMKLFPRTAKGVQDDIVDSLAWLVRLALDVAPGAAPPEEKRVILSWRDRLAMQQRSNRTYMEG